MRRIVLTVILAGAFTAAAQTWEYATLEMIVYETRLDYAWYSPSDQVPFKNSLGGVLRELGHPSVRSEGEGDFQEFLFYAGADGWELTAIDGSQFDRIVYVFKRLAAQ